MKELIFTSVLVLLVSSLVYAAEKARPEDPPQPIYALDEKAGKANPSKQETEAQRQQEIEVLQKRMESSINNAIQEKNREERHKLMQEHMKSMHEGMQMMQKMNGDMMGHGGKTGKGNMENRMGRMENQMQMMQMMMEHMMKHESAQHVH